MKRAGLDLKNNYRGVAYLQERKMHNIYGIYQEKDPSTHQRESYMQFHLVNNKVKDQKIIYKDFGCGIEGYTNGNGEGIGYKLLNNYKDVFRLYKDKDENNIKDFKDYG